MRKHYHMHNRHNGDQRQVWGVALIVLALLILFSKAWVFPLLFFAGIWWVMSRGVCRSGWHMDRFEFDTEKRKRKNDEDDESDYIIV